MNVVILRCKNCDEANRMIYIKPSFSACVCRTTPIQSALDKATSGASKHVLSTFYNHFRQF